MSFVNPFAIVRSVLGDALRTARVSGDRPGDRIPVDQIEKSLNDWCRPAIDLTSGRYVPFGPRTFNNIRSLLSNHHDPAKQSEWSQRPRIYCVLRNIDRLDVMSEFVRLKYLDDILPFNESDLPQALRESRPAFVEMQRLCLTSAGEIEKGEKGRHIQFHYDADVHFYHMRELGAGLHGVDHVWSGLSRRHYARKKFLRKLSPQETKRQFDWFEREIGALKRLSHRHLVKIKGTYADPRCFAFLMDPVAKCDLSQYLLNIRDELLPNLRYFFGCLAGAIDYLHGNKVYHMDIKLRNILVKGNKIYVTDFGTAHDWSKKERSTTYSALARTLRYVPPEHVHDLNAPKNYAFDIWSLGVVFLEMATVLRGASVREFDNFLSTHGSRGLAVYNNSTATNYWLGRLRTRPGPDYDNMPLMWVKDMLVPDPQKRPLARQIRGQILDYYGFCGTCCAVPELEWEMLPKSPFGQGDLTDDDSVVEYIDAEERTTHVYEGLQEHIEVSESQGRTTIQSWMDRVEIAHMERVNRTTEAERLPFEIEEDDAEVDGDIASQFGQEPDAVNLVSDPVPHRLSSLRFFAQLEEQQETISSPEPALLFDIESDGGVSSVRSNSIRAVDDGNDADVTAICEQLDGLDENMQKLPPSDLETISEESDIFYDLDPPSLEEQSRPDGMKDNRDLGVGEPALSPDTKNKPTQEQAEVQNIPAESAQQLENEHKSIPEENEESSKPKKRKKSKKADTKAVKFTSEVDDTFPNSNTKSRSDQQLNDIAEEVDSSEPTSLNPPPSPPSPSPPEYSPSSQPLPSASADRLTARNLQQLNAENTEPKSKIERRKIRLKGGISAKKYMQQVVRKEKTDAATSVMSERTRTKLKGQLLTAWMNESSPILESYVRKGSAAAVRELLAAGCNPGTKKKPRPGPLLIAVRKASLRHNKCADALLRAGANVNVKTSQTGQTPLSLAIEHTPFPGYRGLIWTLLHYGADPNIQDKNGDYPLLQILYNGYEPLEEHRRQALALILEESQFSTNVNVEPPGTLNRPLHLAARRKDPYATGMLLEKGARPNAKNGAGQSPFAVAVGTWTSKMNNDHKQVTKLLLSHGANVNEAIGMDKVPPLHSAIKYGQADLVELLMFYSADPSQKDARGKNAYMVCEDTLSKNKISQDTADDIKSLLDLYNNCDWGSDQSSVVN